MKTRSSKSQKIDISPKGLIHGLSPKIGIFPTFLLANIGQENAFYHILQRKSNFLGYKNKKFKKSKNWHFSKGDNPWFWSKKGHFSNFFFWHYRQKKVVYDIQERENPFRGYKNNKFKKTKNGHFSTIFFFRQYRPGKCLLRYSPTKKQLSRLLKQELQKVEKLTFFQRG